MDVTDHRNFNGACADGKLGTRVVLKDVRLPLGAALVGLVAVLAVEVLRGLQNGQHQLRHLKNPAGSQGGGVVKTCNETFIFTSKNTYFEISSEI